MTLLNPKDKMELSLFQKIKKYKENPNKSNEFNLDLYLNNDNDNILPQSDFYKSDFIISNFKPNNRKNHFDNNLRNDDNNISLINIYRNNVRNDKYNISKQLNNDEDKNLQSNSYSHIYSNKKFQINYLDRFNSIDKRDKSFDESYDKNDKYIYLDVIKDCKNIKNNIYIEDSNLAKSTFTKKSIGIGTQGEIEDESEPNKNLNFERENHYAKLENVSSNTNLISNSSNKISLRNNSSKENCQNVNDALSKCKINIYKIMLINKKKNKKNTSNNTIKSCSGSKSNLTSTDTANKNGVTLKKITASILKEQNTKIKNIKEKNQMEEEITDLIKRIKIEKNKVKKLTNSVKTAKEKNHKEDVSDYRIKIKAEDFGYLNKKNKALNIKQKFNDNSINNSTNLGPGSYNSEIYNSIMQNNIEKSKYSNFSNYYKIKYKKSIYNNSNNNSMNNNSCRFNNIINSNNRNKKLGEKKKFKYESSNNLLKYKEDFSSIYNKILNPNFYFTKNSNNSPGPGRYISNYNSVLHKSYSTKNYFISQQKRFNYLYNSNPGPGTYSQLNLWNQKRKSNCIYPLINPTMHPYNHRLKNRFTNFLKRKLSDLNNVKNNSDLDIYLKQNYSTKKDNKNYVLNKPDTYSRDQFSQI